MPKLVRDRVPEIIRSKGESPWVRRADEREYASLLERKLDEELKEFRENPSVEELADILEVVYAIAKHNEWNVDAMRERKAQARGGFVERYVLETAYGKKP